MSAPTNSAGSTPSGEAAPFLVASPTDHSPDIVLVTAIGIALADDTVFTLATVRTPWAELLEIELVIR
jgi:hypothetical protein